MTRRAREPLEAALLALARDEPVPDLGAIDPDRLLYELEYHRLLGLAQIRLSEAVCPEGLLERIRLLLQPQRLRTLLLRQAWERAAAALDEQGISALVLKGPVLADYVYRRPGARLYRDLDLLVPSASFGEALHALERAGFAVADRNWVLIRTQLAGELKLGLTGYGVVDLHWHLLFAQSARNRFSIPMRELFERARHVQADAAVYRTLDPADTILQLAIHATREGADRLIWLKDIEQAIRRDEPDWDDLVRRARSWGTHLAVGGALLRTASVLAAPVPREVVGALLGPRWRRVTEALDRAFPPQRTRERGSPATLLARASSANTAQTARAVAGGLLHRTGRVLRRRDWQRDELMEDPSSPSSLLHEAGGPEDRDAFLRAVASEDPGA